MRIINRTKIYKVVRTSTVPISLNILLKGQLKFLNQFFEIKAVSSRGNDLEEIRIREGVGVKVLEMERKISLFKDLASLINMYIYLRQEKPQIIHSITPKAGLISMLAGKMAGVPIRMHTFTGLIFPTKKGTMQKILIKMDQLLCWAATNIYPEGKGVRSDLEKYKITSKPLKIIANGNVSGIDLSHYNPDTIDEVLKINLKKSLKISDSDFVFIFVGRLVGDKGINELVEAYVKIRDQNTKLLLVGPYENDDPLKKETLKKIQEYEDIISTGFQKDVRPYFSISNVLVFPSYREGFPNVVIQAGAMDLPSIVSDINGCNEIILHGKNGIVIPSKNIEKLAEAMKEVKKNTKQYTEMKRNARNIISSRYEQSIIWNATLYEYNMLLEKIN